jgi:dolichyl-phosphate-mannose-protein mannosyltransferase
MAAAEAATQRDGQAGTAGQPAVPARPTLSDRLPRAWLFPVAVFAATWLLILAAWYGSDVISGHSHSWTWHFLFKDATFYLGIAEHSYTGDPGKAAFFPLFPLLIRFTSYLTGGNYPFAGLIVSVACGAASAVAVWALAARVRDRWVADRAVMLYCVFPGAMTFGMLYSEPLSVAIGAAALLALLDRRWLLAGIIGALGTAERPTLIILAVISGVAAIQAIWTRREWQALLAPALTPLGILAYFGYLGQRYHDYAYWFRIENSGWNQHIDWGVHTVGVLLWLNPRDAHHRLFVVVLMIMFVAALAGIGLMIAARLPLPVTLFGILTIMLSVISSAGDTKPRFVWAAFPIFIGAAAKLPRAVYWPVLVLSAAGLVFLLGGWPYHLIGQWTAP